MAKEASRVNGRHGENMWVTDDELCFRTAGKVHKMARAQLASLVIANAEDARADVTDSDLVPLGAWTDEMPSVGGKSLFIVAKDEGECWVMEISKSQLPNAQSFVGGAAPQGDHDEKVIPGRAIDTPLGALFTIGSIASVFGAYFFVFNLEMPIVGLMIAIAGIVMFFNIK